MASASSGHPGRLGWAIGVVLVVLVAVNVVGVLVSHAALVAGPAGAVGLLALARWAGLSWQELGLGPGTWRRGLAWAGAEIAAIAVVFAAGAALPLTRGAFRDSRYHLGWGHALLTALVPSPRGRCCLRRSPSAGCSGACSGGHAGRASPLSSRPCCSVCGTCCRRSAWPRATRRSAARSARERQVRFSRCWERSCSRGLQGCCSASYGGAAEACSRRPGCTGPPMGSPSSRRRPCGPGCLADERLPDTRDDAPEGGEVLGGEAGRRGAASSSRPRTRPSTCDRGRLEPPWRMGDRR